MNDRYLFKAKRADNGEWVQGYYFQIQENGYILLHIGNKILTDEIDISTLCQCTGLKDKNGKLIWENDIINTQCGKTVVVWDKAEWCIKWIDDFIWRKDLHFWAIENPYGVKTISNIFDNPELLEERDAIDERRNS